MDQERRRDARRAREGKRHYALERHCNGAAFPKWEPAVQTGQVMPRALE